MGGGGGGLFNSPRKNPNIILLWLTKLLGGPFNLPGPLMDTLLNKFLRSRSVAIEPYVKAFQYKILNSILYTNAKLYKIGFKMNDSCSFCSSEPETLYHILHLCPYSIDFWRDFEVFWHQLLKENIQLSLQDVLVGMIP